MLRFVLLLALAASLTGCLGPRARHPLDRAAERSAARAAGDRSAASGSLRGAGPDADYRSTYVVPQAFYFGVKLRESTLAGEFDGGRRLTVNGIAPDSETIRIPNAGEDVGEQFVIGWMYHGVAAELSYTRIDYNGVVDYHSLSLDGLYYFRANSEVQPFLYAGMVLPWIDLDGASTFQRSGGPVRQGDAELGGGVGIECGGGVAWYLAPWLQLDVRGTYLWQEFTTADGELASRGDIDDSLEGPSWGISVGLTYLFIPRRYR